ncbi:MAG: hypothetical protein KZQ79_05920, partial [Candidatus Thiodiazotropha sp. (ex Lucinoma borealis)]|nr:hypothetical protein [Candidatus Thiodiazotropha sp. (ex Lucinoma borealis)]
MRLTALSLAISSLLVSPSLFAEKQTEILTDVHVEGDAETAPAVTVIPMDVGSQGFAGRLVI